MLTIDKKNDITIIAKCPIPIFKDGFGSLREELCLETLLNQLLSSNSNIKNGKFKTAFI